jgi:hypothetical protein
MFSEAILNESVNSLISELILGEFDSACEGVAVDSFLGFGLSIILRVIVGVVLGLILGIVLGVVLGFILGIILRIILSLRIDLLFRFRTVI